MSVTMRIGNLELRQFSIRDTRELYRIRNHLTVRQFMSNPELIPYRKHVHWVVHSLVGNEHLLLFLVRSEPGTRAVGIAQLRISNQSGEIGAIFRERVRHQVVTAVAAVALLRYAFDRLRLKEVVSYVIPSHIHAIKFNKMFGAWEEPSDHPGMVKLRLDSATCMANETVRRLSRRMERQGFVVAENADV